MAEKIYYKKDPYWLWLMFSALICLVMVITVVLMTGDGDGNLSTGAEFLLCVVGIALFTYAFYGWCRFMGEKYKIVGTEYKSSYISPKDIPPEHPTEQWKKVEEKKKD